jgi:tungstate transport system substrate-binding protein
MTMRRSLTMLALAATMVMATWGGTSAQPASVGSPKPAASKIVRLFAVRTEFDSGLLDGLLADFQAKTGFQIERSTGKDTYEELAKAGKVDVILSHYRHGGLGAFVTQGYGLWPEPVMANVTAFLAPPGDPAHIKGLTDGIEMFRRIAAAKAPFVVNGDPNSRYLLETLWNAAGSPDKRGWYMDLDIEGLAAAQRAVTEKAYAIWGVTAFIDAKQSNNLPLDLVIPNDSLMQRVIVCVVSNPAKVPHANVAGAKALQSYLLLPATQARIAAFRYAGITVPVFLPAGRNNEDAVLKAVTGKVPASGGARTR